MPNPDGSPTLAEQLEQARQQTVDGINQVPTQGPMSGYTGPDQGNPSAVTFAPETVTGGPGAAALPTPPTGLAGLAAMKKPIDMGDIDELAKTSGIPASYQAPTTGLAGLAAKLSAPPDAAPTNSDLLKKFTSEKGTAWQKIGSKTVELADAQDAASQKLHDATVTATQAQQERSQAEAGLWEQKSQHDALVEAERTKQQAQNAAEIDRQNKLYEAEMSRKVNDQVDPERWQKSRSTGQNVASVIGLLFSGAGSGLSHQQNMAYDVINNRINNDIQAQRDNIANAKDTKARNLAERGSYLGHLQRKGFDINEAAMLAKDASLNSVRTHIQKFAAENEGTLAAQRASEADAKLAADQATNRASLRDYAIQTQGRKEQVAAATAQARATLAERQRLEGLGAVTDAKGKIVGYRDAATGGIVDKPISSLDVAKLAGEKEKEGRETRAANEGAIKTIQLAAASLASAHEVQDKLVKNYGVKPNAEGSAEAGGTLAAGWDKVFGPAGVAGTHTAQGSDLGQSLDNLKMRYMATEHIPSSKEGMEEAHHSLTGNGTPGAIYAGAQKAREASYLAISTQMAGMTPPQKAEVLRSLSPEQQQLVIDAMQRGDLAARPKQAPVPQGAVGAGQ